ncbi:fatty-acid amide hydrolase 2-A-like [Stegodyphus dumicola]|uniref:fatty-acid amide hydrolase 2-A-like n=1 Tax=Stegodyphus dumicola TaxID=202533 RepID=UPI0015AFE074|nr:fatty-acid amide hydrolase 2-A-like [Stegodyphus dumicola]
MSSETIANPEDGLSPMRLKSEDVIRAYIQRISEVEPFINAIVERRYADALNEAKDADVLVASGKLTKEQLAETYPLLGVPLSVKVIIKVKGLRSTGSSLLFKDVRASEDAPAVAALRNAGAIVLVTTNAPEMSISLETSNKIYGRTNNPYDISRTSGGNSGGESALLSAGGSVLGLGNDLMGSIRIPCLFTGLFGHKPSRNMAFQEESFPLFNPKLSQMLCTGPLCRYAEDLVTSMSVLSYGQKTHRKFGQAVNFRDIKIFYMLSLDANFATPVSEDFQQAIKEVVSYFQTTYQVNSKETHIPLLKQSNSIALHCVLSAAGNITEVLTSSNGDINSFKELFKWLIGMSDLTLGPLACMNFAKCFLWYNESKVPHYENLAKQLSEEFDSLLDEKSVFLFPTFPVTAFHHNESHVYIPNVCYTSIFNVLGLPATQCPLGLNSQGLPIGIQIIGRKSNDSLTIAFAAELEKAFGGWVPPGSKRK